MPTIKRSERPDQVPGLTFDDTNPPSVVLYASEKKLRKFKALNRWMGTADLILLPTVPLSCACIVLSPYVIGSSGLHYPTPYEIREIYTVLPSLASILCTLIIPCLFLAANHVFGSYLTDRYFCRLSNGKPVLVIDHAGITSALMNLPSNFVSWNNVTDIRPYGRLMAVTARAKYVPHGLWQLFLCHLLRAIRGDELMISADYADLTRKQWRDDIQPLLVDPDRRAAFFAQRSIPVDASKFPGLV
jgi:hypothetical protein